MIKNLPPASNLKLGWSRSKDPAEKPEHTETLALNTLNAMASRAAYLAAQEAAGMVYKMSINPGFFEKKQAFSPGFATIPVILQLSNLHISKSTSSPNKLDSKLFRTMPDLNSSEPFVIESVVEVLNRANSIIHDSTNKFVKTHLAKPPLTPYAARKQASDLKASLELMVDAMFEKKFAEKALARADEIVELSEVLVPTHTPGYEAAVKAGADVRARMISGSEMVNSMELAKLMGVSRETVNQRRQKGTLLALAHGSRSQHYPVWQLEPKVGHAMPELLTILRQLDPWTQYLFFTQSNPELDGMSPLDELRNGESDRVIAVATQYADMMAPA